METIKAILTRRSIREYTAEFISEKTIYELLRAAMHAPSARNYQPWHFITITDREVLDKIPTVHPYAEMIYKAPLAILVCGDLNLESNEKYIAVDCSAATQNLLLAAHDLGLGAVWLGVYPRVERMRGLSNILKVPDHIIPVSLVSIGYPSENKESENRFQESRIHKNHW